MTLVLTGNTEVPTTRTELFVVQPGKILLFQIHLNITANEAPGMGGGGTRQLFLCDCSPHYQGNGDMLVIC